MPSNFSQLFNQSTKVVEQCRGCVYVNQYDECDRWVHPAAKWEQPEGCETFTPAEADKASGDPDPEQPTFYY